MPGIRDAHRLTADQVSAQCDPASLRFGRTDEIPAFEAIFGQERAVRAIEFGLGMGPGYHLFAAGPDGIGKSTIVESFLRRRAAQMPAPPDWLYVHNFDDPDQPIGISLPAGVGRLFAAAVELAVSAAARELRAAFESDAYARRQQQLGTAIEQQRAALIQQLQERARDFGFYLQFTPAGINSAPLVEGQPATEEQFAALSEERRNAIQEQGHQLEQVVQDMLLRMRGIERGAQAQVVQLDEEIAGAALDEIFGPVLAQWGAADAEIRAFFEATRADMLHERDRFRQGPAAPAPVGIPGLTAPQGGPPTRRYEVNVIVSNDPQAGAPVIRERHPTYYNLLGRIEYQSQFGAVVTDHTMVKAGSLAHASGGFIVLRLRDLLTQPTTLDALKRALAGGELAIENIAEAYGLVPTLGLRPEPMPLDTKVVIVGDGALYALLYRYDPEFRELFRVKADFEIDVERTPDNIHGIANFINAQCVSEDMRCFSAAAVAALIEYSSRMVEDQTRLSANLGDFLDVVRQAEYWAAAEQSDTVEARHVERALEERIYRSSLIRDRIKDAIDRGEIYVDVESQQVGQINALAVYDLGDIQFGRPSRITCVTSAGSGSIVMIDRDSDMAGKIHNKGFLILRGFLTHRFGQAKSSALAASLTFEQQYGEIDGDSASSTELYVLLSALAEAPIDQGVAVTGSVDQLGRVQPIGGANAKVEGFFEICLQRGLNGRQGVMIPAANVPHLTVRSEVRQAVADGRFNIWAVSTIEEGIELLTGIPAGERGANGEFPVDTIYHRVEDRLDAFAAEVQARPDRAATGHAPHVTMPSAPAPTPPGIPPAPPPAPPARL
ncbi:MAG: AAA family ATPase [Chloroflexi bacterium]|nr:AAA family ATPase [Chloroflexota bacterium]